MSIHLILGGSRSGKSRHAQALATRSGKSVVFISTCATKGLDDEMRKRIKKHQQDRPASWKTVENEFQLESVFKKHANKCVILDCLTLWLSYWQMKEMNEDKILKHLKSALKIAPKQLIVVSNEIGLGLVPEYASGREFRDLTGRAHQLVASLADDVEFMVAGLPLIVKSNVH